MAGWESNVRRVTPYTPGEQPKAANVIKLNTNENPYPPSLAAVKAYQTADPARLRLYPDPEASVLRDAIAETYGLDPAQVFVGVGSDDVLAMAYLTFFNSDVPILFPDITYSFYDVWADLFRIPYKDLPLTDDFSIDPADYKQPNGGIIFPNPNAPTGKALALSAVEEIVATNPDSVVIVDEAYVDFGAQTALPLIEKYDNLLVVQTFSKSRAGAGLRIGYAFGQAALIACLNDVKFSFNSYTMNQLTLAAGSAMVRDGAWFAETTEKIKKTRARTVQELNRLGFDCLESAANFIFATHRSVPAKELFDALRAGQIYVRYFNKPRIDNHLRITVGTDEQMDALFAFLEDYLKNRG